MRLSRLYVQKDAHDDGIWASAWASNDVLLTGSVDESVMLWTEDDDGLRRLHTFMGHHLGVVSVAAHPDGSYAATSSLDSLVRVWDTEDRHTTLQLLEMTPGECWSIDFSPTRERMVLAVAGGATGNVSVWNVQGDAKEMTSMVLPKVGDSDSVMYSPPAWYGIDMGLWYSQKEAPDGTKRKQRQFVLCTVFSPDGRKLATSGKDGLVAVFDVETGQIIRHMADHNMPVRALAFTPDSRMLLTGSDDMHINMYDAHNGSLVEAMSGHEAWVLSLSCHPNGAHIASGGSDSKVILWDLNTRKILQTVNEHNDQVWSVRFRKDGTRLASVSDDASVALYACG